MKYRYIILVFLLAIVLNTNSYSQNDYHGNWIIPTSLLDSWDGNPNDPQVSQEKIYNLIFSNGSLTGYSFENNDDHDHDKPSFSAGAYKENGELDFYILGDRLYFQGNEYEPYGWAYKYKTDNKIIRLFSDDDSRKYRVICSYRQAQKGLDTEFVYYDVNITGNTLTIGNHVLLPYTYSQLLNSSNGFAVSNLNEDNERTVYFSLGQNGLFSSVLDENNNFDDSETLLDITDWGGDNFEAYNLEINDWAGEDVTVAWITTPYANDGPNENSEIYLYYDNSEEIISPELGIIGGIEFSKKDNNILYVSTQDAGIVAIDYVNSIIDEELVINQALTPSISNDFTRTYLQTAPDGNIYGVSDDGYRLGQISMDPNGSGEFDDDYFEFPEAEMFGGVGTYIFVEINNEYVKYYTLPDNEDVFYGLYGYTPPGTTGVLCHACDASVNIHVKGGIPNYSISVSDGTDTYFTNQFSYDNVNHIFTGSDLCEGTYSFTVSDSDNPPATYTSTFTIDNFNAYDFADEMLEINKDATDLPPSLSDLTWDSNDDFIESGSILFEKGFKLINHTTLTVNNLDLKFDRKASVYIGPGSKLILNGAVLTNYDCDEEYMWNGVYVEGNDEAEQTDENMGVLDMNSSTIEFAKTAVTLHDADIINRGGIIRAENSSFLNNRQAIEFYPYHNMKHFDTDGDGEIDDGEEVIELDNVSYIRYSTFTNDANYLEDALSFTKFIRLWNIKGLSIKKCDFNSGGKNGIAIDALDAGFHVTGDCNNALGCTFEQWDRSTFVGFDKAIYTRNTTNVLYPVNVQYSLFDDNNYGIFANNLKHISNFENNIFKVGNDQNTKEKNICGIFFGRGIHIEASDNFSIENNTFERSTNIPEGSDVMGILALNNPSNHDVIFNNKFTGLKIGNEVYGNNRYVSPNGGSDPWGIEYQCNQNFNNAIDFEVIGEVLNPGMINPNMGFTNISARNTFTSTSYTGLEWHWRNMGMQQENYYLHSSESTTNYNPTLIETTNNYPTLFVKQVASGINQCPSSGGIGIEKTTLTPEEQQEQEMVFATAYQDFQSVEDIYSDLKDGGSTTGTSLTIAAAQPTDTWELRDNLLGKSPHLSREILQEAANRTDVLPNSVLLDILAANPDELKKEDFIQYLGSKAEPLPDYMLNILRDLSAGTTYKTALLNEMALHRNKQVLSANKIIKSLMNEEEQNLTSIKNWLNNLGGVSTDIQIAEIFISEGNYNDAMTLLNMIPDLYDLQGDALSQFNADKNLLNLKIQLKDDNRNIEQLNSSEITQLEQLAYGDHGMARSASRNILEAFYGYEEFCDCMDRGSNKRVSTEISNQKEESPLAIEASPNPANHYVEFTYELSEIDSEGIIIITDINGKTVKSFKVDYNKGLQAWDTSKLPSGSYIYTLKTKYFEKSDKLIIQ